MGKRENLAERLRALAEELQEMHHEARAVAGEAAKEQGEPEGSYMHGWFCGTIQSPIQNAGRLLYSASAMLSLVGEQEAKNG